MTENDEWICRLLSASEVSYWVEEPKGLTACPLYNTVDYADTPVILDGGKDDINAITVGTTNDGAVIVACRGTLSSSSSDDKRQMILDWIDDLDADPVAVPGLPDGCFAHDGFFKAVNDVKSPDCKNVFEEVSTQLAAIGDQARLFITGHSKGGAMSYIVAAQLIAQNRTPDAIISFAAARPGNNDLAKFVEEKMMGREIRRYEVKNDIVPHTPPSSEIWDLLIKLFPKELKKHDSWNYESIGQLYYYNNNGKLEIPVTKEENFEVNSKRILSLTKAILEGQFKEIIDEHSLVDSYGATNCPDLS